MIGFGNQVPRLTLHGLLFLAPMLCCCDEPKAGAADSAARATIDVADVEKQRFISSTAWLVNSAPEQLGGVRPAFRAVRVGFDAEAKRPVTCGEYNSGSGWRKFAVFTLGPDDNYEYHLADASGVGEFCGSGTKSFTWIKADADTLYSLPSPGSWKAKTCFFTIARQHYSDVYAFDDATRKVAFGNDMPLKIENYQVAGQNLIFPALLGHYVYDRRHNSVALIDPTIPGNKPITEQCVE